MIFKRISRHLHSCSLNSIRLRDVAPRRSPQRKSYPKQNPQMAPHFHNFSNASSVFLGDALASYEGQESCAVSRRAWRVWRPDSSKCRTYGVRNGRSIDSKTRRDGVKENVVSEKIRGFPILVSENFKRGILSKNCGVRKI